MADDPKVERPRGLAGEYLEQAVEALYSAGSPDHLYSGLSRHELSGKPAVEDFATVVAINRRRAAARASVLFSALAAEAYVNEFLGYYLSGRDLEAIDRLNPEDKYATGTRLASGATVFERGKQPLQTLRELFKLRDRLVHPKPGYGPPRSPIDAARETETTFTPLRAANFAVHVAAAAKVLVTRASGEQLDIPADFIWHGRAAIVGYARKAGRLPRFDASPEPPLISQAIQSVGRRSRKRTR